MGRRSQADYVRSLFERLNPGGIHRDGEVITFCDRCGEPTGIYRCIEYTGIVGIVPCAEECVCTRAARRRAADALELERRKACAARAFSLTDVSGSYREATLDGWGQGNASLLSLGRALVVPAGTPRVGAIISGGPGIGKTYLLCAITNELVSRGSETRYVSIPHLFQRIRGSYNRRDIEHESKIIEELISADVVLLDELGLGRGGSWQRGVLYEIVDGARVKGSTIVCATNLGREQLKGWLHDTETGSDCIYDRLLEGSPFVTVEGENLRMGNERLALARLRERVVS